MRRQSLHLSVDRAMAVMVGRRKRASPVVLTVDASAAEVAGTMFYRGNESVWLADGIPAQFINAGA